MNNDLISRSTVIEILQAKADMAVSTNAQMVYLNAARMVKIIPAVDAEPVRHGQWVEEEVYDGDVYYDCSACGESWVLLDGNPADNGMDYCPHCGARMGMEEES